MMETPKKTNSYSETDIMSTPSTSSSTKSGAIVTPGSGSSSTRGEQDSSKGTKVQEPHDHDVLCGRGGSINSHPGNERFRQLVEKRKRVYLTARFKREKRLIANSILSEIRSLQPPGRFLSRDTKTATWYDIGDEKARDKTSQALRENAPSIRAEIEVEINQQRAEMQRAEDEAAYVAPPSGPPHPYYKQPWGFYAPYHGYGQYHPGAEPPRHPYDERYERQWHGQYADWGEHPPSVQRQCQSPASASASSRRGDELQHYNEAPEQHAPPPPQEGEQVAGFDVPTFVSSVPSSIAAWTRTSFSFGGHSHASEHEQSTNPPKPPLPYTHQSPSQEQDRQGRRVVHFEDDGRSSRNHPSHYPYQQQQGHSGQRRYPPPGPQGGAGPDFYEYSSTLHGDGYRQQQGEGTPSFPPNHPATAPITPENAARKGNIKRQHQALEPHDSAAPYQAGEQQSSLLSQVATHILGSWDTSMVCANSSHEEPMMTTGLHYDQQAKPLNTPSSEMMAPPLSLADAMEDDEQEGQEVELVDMMDYDDPDDLPDHHPHDDDDIRDDIDHMPPPEGDMPPPPRRIEIDWPSKMVGCQSNWLPETFNQSSFFNKQPNVLSPSASLEMDVSAVGTEGISCTDSIGGASLCQVFSHDQIADGEIEDAMEQPEISQIPSWERSVRSKSPSPDDFT